jgi:RND family efflux transporter MFP subunit
MAEITSANAQVRFVLQFARGGCGGSGPPERGASAETAAPAPQPTPAAAATEATPLPPATESALDTDPSFDTVLAPLHDVEVFARLDGELMAIDVEEGQRVRPGARLAQIDDRARRALLDEREAALARAESAWQRGQRLAAEQVLSDEQFIQARADWQIARAQRDRATIEWQRCAVRSPIPGLVALRRAQIGQSVKSGDLLFRVSNPDRLRAELLIPETRIGTVRVGQPATLTPVGGGPPVPARITRVNPLVDPGTGTFRVAIDVDNRQGRLHGGVSVRVALDSARAARK